jgi:Methyltransferase domain
LSGIVGSRAEGQVSTWGEHLGLIDRCFLLYPRLAEWPIQSRDGEPVDAHIVEIETSPPSEAVARVKAALAASLAGDSEIDPRILKIPGMSGRCYRHFINSLVRMTPDARYLEVGTWAGSTLCAAISNNHVSATAIDNWSEFGGPKVLFESHLAQFTTADAEVMFIESDFRKVDFRALGKFNIYLFDGPHEYRDQYDGLEMALPALDEHFVLIVDDWNWERVRDGTRRAMRANRISPLYSTEIRSSLDDSHPIISCELSDWHDGYFFCVAGRDG